MIYLNVSEIVKKGKGRDLHQPYDKNPTTNRNVKRAKWQHKNGIKMFDYSAIKRHVYL